MLDREGDAMKRNTMIFGILLLSIAFFLTGCIGFRASEVQTHDTGIGTGIYYLNENGSELVAEEITVPDTSRKGQIRYMVEQLISPPVGKLSPISSGTTLQSVTIKDDVAVVDFSEEFYDADGIKQTIAPVAIAKTLCTLDFISGVQILVEGDEAVGTDQKPLGILWESDLVVSKGEPSGATKTSLVLYFSDGNAEYLVPERRNVELSGGNTVEKVVVEELLKGPTEGGHARTIPQETKLLSIETKNNVCFVNFSKEFVERHSGGTTSEMLTVYSLVNSLTELGTVDKVQFLIEGEKKEEYIHMAFNEPIVRDKSMIRQ